MSCRACLGALGTMLAVIAAVAACPCLSSASDADSAGQMEKPLRVTIGRAVLGVGSARDTLPVMLGAPGYGISAFDFKIGCDSRAVEIVDILPGRLSDSCRWKFFRARRLDATQKAGRPRTLWRAIAVAEIVPDSIRPLCYGFDDDVSALRIVLSRGEVGAAADSIAPIFFFWEECGDNVISDKSGDKLLMSLAGDSEPADSITPALPTRVGAPPECVRGNTRNRPFRRVDFRNGGVELRHGDGKAVDEASESQKH